jgi:hypothetical protein
MLPASHPGAQTCVSPLLSASQAGTLKDRATLQDELIKLSK